MTTVRCRPTKVLHQLLDKFVAYYALILDLFAAPRICFFCAIRFLILFFLIFSFLGLAERWIKLAISSAFERTLIYRIVSYRIVLPCYVAVYDTMSSQSSTDSAVQFRADAFFRSSHLNLFTYSYIL